MVLAFLVVDAGAPAGGVVFAQLFGLDAALGGAAAARAAHQGALAAVAARVHSEALFARAAAAPARADDTGALRLPPGAPFAVAKTIVWLREAKCVALLAKAKANERDR